MKTVALIVACAVLIVTASQGLTSVNADSPFADTAQAADTRAGQNFQDKLDDLKIEARKGEAVVLRAKQLRNKNKGVARAMKDLERKGLRPAFESGASILAVSKSGKYKKTSAQETTIVEGDVELTFLSYDDGEPNTWEGIIYYRTPLVETVDYAVIDISTSNYNVTYEQNYSYTRYTNPVDHTPVGYNRTAPRRNATARSTEIMPISYVSGTRTNRATNQLFERLRSFIRCAIAGCGAVLDDCKGTGALFPVCFAAKCFPILLECAEDHTPV